MTNKHHSQDDYVETLVGAGKAMATHVRTTVTRLVPDATQAIKYNMPAFQLDGRSFLYFGVWKKHVGLYPVYRGDGSFEALVAPYRTKTDTVQFALDQPLPMDVIEPIILAQALLSRRY